jgi:hypothetical protein
MLSIAPTLFSSVDRHTHKATVWVTEGKEGEYGLGEKTR